MVHKVFLARSDCEVNKKGQATFHDTDIEIQDLSIFWVL